MEMEMLMLESLWKEELYGVLITLQMQMLSANVFLHLTINSKSQLLRSN